MEFISYPKTPRLENTVCCLTEKIDGTNAQVVITPEGEVLAGSRNRWIVPGDDNFGFAAWVYEHAEELRTLGVGQHFGEWWGRGIGRNYGVDFRKFSLFNVWRERESLPACVDVVPVLYKGGFDSGKIAAVQEALVQGGSVAAPGFMRVEGMVLTVGRGSGPMKIILDK